MHQDYRNSPYPNGRAYQVALDNPLYTTDSDEGKTYRADVNQKLSDSPNVIPSPGEERKQNQWKAKDGVQ